MWRTEKNNEKGFFAEIGEEIFGHSLSGFTALSRAKKAWVVILSLFFALWIFVSLKIIEPIFDHTFYEMLMIALAYLFCSMLVMMLFVFFMAKEYACAMRKPNLKIMLLYFVFSILLMIFLYYINLPVGITVDINEQMAQALNNEYSNWHPFAHTILFYKLPMVLFGETIESVAMMHYFFIGLVLWYTGYSFYRFGINQKIIIAVLLLTLLNKNLWNTIDYPWKDIPYSFGILALTVNCMWIYLTDGQWLKKAGSIILFVLSCFFVLFMRHNGILSFCAVMLFLILAYKPIRKRLLILSVSILAFYFVISNPVYSALGIYKHNETFAEAMGVPNNQIAYVIIKDGDISEEEYAFLDNIVPIDIVNETYEAGNYNITKWYINEETNEAYYNGQYIQNNKAEFLKVWLSIIKKNKRYAVEAYYFTVMPILKWNFLSNSDTRLYFNVGLAFFIAMFCITVSSVRDIRKFIPSIPMLVNMLGVMLLLTGGEQRFVFANLTTGLVLAAFSFILVGDNEQKSKKPLANKKYM